MRAMKDSGIPWIGKIPESWLVPKLLYVLRAKISDGPHETPNYMEDGIPFISIDSLNDSKTINFENVRRYISDEDYEQYCQKTKIEHGDILFSKAATIGKTAIVGNERFMVWSPLAVIKHDPSRINNTYLYYLLNCSQLINAMALSGSVNTQINVGMREMEQARIPLPLLFEQKKIAEFLDAECTRIDAVMEQTRASIEEYKKLKQSIITEAVTKGIRPNRSMKDSGIDWVKEIPVEWLVIPAKHLFRDSDVRKQEGDEQMTASQQYGIITQKLYMELTGAKVVFANKGIEDWKHIEPYDFVISLRSFQGGLEMSETTGCITWHYIVLRPCKVIHSYFYKWLFKSEIYINALQRTCNFIRDGQDLRYSNFIQVPLFEPSIGEQREISDYLNSKCAEIEAMITKKRKLLSEMEFYKKSLIFEYVTGKKEVI